MDDNVCSESLDEHIGRQQHLVATEAAALAARSMRAASTEQRAKTTTSTTQTRLSTLFILSCFSGGTAVSGDTDNIFSKKILLRVRHCAPSSLTSSNARVSSNAIPPTEHPTSRARSGRLRDTPAWRSWPPPPAFCCSPSEGDASLAVVTIASVQRSAHRLGNPKASEGPQSYGRTSSGLESKTISRQK